MGIVILRTLRQLFGYLIVATLLISPIGAFYILCGIGAFFRISYCLKQWFALDVLACTTIHGTMRRTISGYTGQHIHLKRYYYQAKIIDWLALMCGDKPNHCVRAWSYEKRLLNIN